MGKFARRLIPGPGCRRAVLGALGLTLLLLAPAVRSAEPPAGRPAHTYSIVARDPDTGELGVAVQSHWFAVGLDVPWAEPGVGAVATQSFVNPRYGLLGLELMRAGKPAPEALKALLGKDPGRDVRQVAMIDGQGRVGVHTGSRCIQFAGHLLGKNYAVQSNLMANDKVPAAMARAFESKRGDLAERMLAALEAGQAVGGDIRGQQSAALVVVGGKVSALPWEGRVLNVRVDDNPEPLRELRRLVQLQRAYRRMDAGDQATERKDFAAAQREYGAAEALAPGSQEMTFWHAVALANLGKTAEAAPLFGRVFQANRAWQQLLPRLVAAGVLPNDPKLLEKLNQAPAAAPVQGGGNDNSGWE